jgi:hypothetical protein
LRTEIVYNKNKCKSNNKAMQTTHWALNNDKEKTKEPWFQGKIREIDNKNDNPQTALKYLTDISNCFSGHQNNSEY